MNARGFMAFGLLALGLFAAVQHDRIQRVETGFSIPLPGGPSLEFDINKLMAVLGAPGLSLAVIEDYKIDWSKGYGFSELGGKPVTARTLFQAASISKSITAAGALVLVQMGKLSLEEDVNQKLVSWKVPESEFTAQSKVTLRELLSHSAGMTISGFPGYAEGEAVPTLLQTLNGEKPANMGAIRVDYVPGTRYRYSGGGFTVAQQLMIDVEHKPFAQFLQEAVLSKIGMSDSNFEQPLPPRLAASAATGYVNGAMLPGKRHVYPELAAAGLWTTPSDLAKFAIEIALSKHGRSNRILSQAMAREMLKPGLHNQGLGVAFDDPNSPDEFDKNGGNRGFTSCLIMFADSGKGLIVMSNSEAATRIAPFITANLAKEYGWSSNPRPKSSGDVMLIVAAAKGTQAAIDEFRYLKAAKLPGYVVNENSMNQFANELLDAGKLDDAIEVLKANNQEYPGNLRTCEALSKAYTQAGKKDLAAQTLEKCPASQH